MTDAPERMMDDLVERLRNPPHPKSIAEIGVVSFWADCHNQMSVTMEYAADRIAELEAENKRLKDEIETAYRTGVQVGWSEAHEKCEGQGCGLL